MEDLAERTGIETRLTQVGVTESDLDRLAADAMLQTRLLGNNPREVQPRRRKSNLCCSTVNCSYLKNRQRQD